MQPASVVSPPLTAAELRHVLSHPESFGLKAHAWYAVDADQAFVDRNPRHCLAGRLGQAAVHFIPLLSDWRNETDQPVFTGTGATAVPIQNALNTIATAPACFYVFRCCWRLPRDVARLTEASSPAQPYPRQAQAGSHLRNDERCTDHRRRAESDRRQPSCASSLVRCAERPRPLSH